MSQEAGSPTFAARLYDGARWYGEGETQVRALDGVTVGFEAGRFTAIMGPSGSGKSTLVQCMAGLDYLSSGRAFIGDHEVGLLDPTALTLLRRRSVGFVFQSFNLVPALTAERNIVLPFTLAKTKPDRERFDRVVAMLGLADRLRHRPRELSGGQQQRVAIARALVAGPDLLIADEPTGNLDSRSSDEVLTFLREAVDTTAQTVVMVTHDPRAAARADRVLILADGRIADDLVGITADALLDRLKELD